VLERAPPDEQCDECDARRHRPATPMLVHPSLALRTSPHTMPSSRCWQTQHQDVKGAIGPGGLFDRSQATGSRANPIGTFNQKIHCQEKDSTIAPRPGRDCDRKTPHPLHTPRARPRRAGATAADRMVSVSGSRWPRLFPGWRAPRSEAHAWRQSSQRDPTVKTLIPTMNMRLRPKRSPKSGAGEEEHGEGQGVGVDRPLQLLGLAPREALMTGSAVVTMRLSREAMKTAQRRPRRSIWLSPARSLLVILSARTAVERHRCAVARARPADWEVASGCFSVRGLYGYSSWFEEAESTAIFC